MEKSNADSILEMLLSVIISYYLIYRMGLSFIKLYNVKAIIIVSSIITLGVLMVFTYTIIKKLGYRDVLKIHKAKGIKEFFVSYFKVYFIAIFSIFIFNPLLDYSLVRLNQPLTLSILFITFSLLLILFRIYYVNTYFEKRIHFGVFLIFCTFFIFLILNSLLLVVTS